MNPTVLAGIIVGPLVGIIGYIIHLGTRMSVAEKLIEQSQLMTLHPRVTRLEDALVEVRHAVSKLAMLDTIHATQAAMQATQAAMMKKIDELIPRGEVETRFRSVDKNIADLWDSQTTRT